MTNQTTKQYASKNFYTIPTINYKLKTMNYALFTALAAGTSKTEQLMHDDPHGIGITVMCMGIVFLCLLLLYMFFAIFGWVADRRSKLASTQPIKPVVSTAKKIEKVRQVTTNILQDGFSTRGRDKEIYVAVISMALKQYLDDVHDIESGIISIKPHQTEWNTYGNQFTN